VAAATATAEFTGADGDHFHAGLAQQGVGVGVAVVTDHHARLHGHHVVAVVPLLALGGKRIAAGFYYAQGLEAEGGGDATYTRYKKTVPGADPVQYADVRRLFRAGEMSPATVEGVL